MTWGPLTTRPAAPPDWVIEQARKAALKSPCLKSRRGVALFDPALEARRVAGTIGSLEREMIVPAVGFNGPPDDERFVCTGTAECRRDCAKLCLHAEDRAIRAAGDVWFSRLDLVHVKVVDGKVVPGGGPSCWQCSRVVVEVGLHGVWLLMTIGQNYNLDLAGQWRFYTAVEFHRETLRACGLGDPS